MVKALLLIDAPLSELAFEQMIEISSPADREIVGHIITPDMAEQFLADVNQGSIEEHDEVDGIHFVRTGALLTLWSPDDQEVTRETVEKIFSQKFGCPIELRVSGSVEILWQQWNI